MGYLPGFPKGETKFEVEGCYLGFRFIDGAPAVENVTATTISARVLVLDGRHVSGLGCYRVGIVVVTGNV